MPHGPANKVGYIILLEVLSWFILALQAEYIAVHQNMMPDSQELVFGSSLEQCKLI